MATHEQSAGGSTTLIIFGATGDLTQRKLLPALFDLHEKQLLPASFRIVGFSRRAFSHDEFRSFAEETLRVKRPDGAPKFRPFLDRIFYQQGNFDDARSYEGLAEGLIASNPEELRQSSNKMFYLAVPPVYYETILRNLAYSGLTIPWNATGWTRVLIEKPFGNNSETAERLDKLLGLLFKEEQIFRIDHYLAKETIQNILTFRFSNALFEPIWDHRYIDRVHIQLFEAEGVETRGAFYDGVGALRDVGQNHLLQMLSLIAMEHPGELTAENVRRKRVEVLEALRLFDAENIATHAVRGQYTGYQQEKNVAPGSSTETYFRITAHCDTKRWRSVPFILESGKKMQKTKTEISLYFKKTESCLCPPEAEQHHENVLTFRIQPEEGISLLFWAKKPGFQFHLEPKKLFFAYHGEGNDVLLPDAYERVLFDCIRGDQLLFTSTQEVGAAWRFIMSILGTWGVTALEPYASGKEGSRGTMILSPK